MKDTENLEGYLEDRIKRYTNMLDKYYKDNKNPSIWGYEEIGRMKGMIFAFELILDGLQEDND